MVSCGLYTKKFGCHMMGMAFIKVAINLRQLRQKQKHDVQCSCPKS